MDHMRTAERPRTALWLITVPSERVRVDLFRALDMTAWQGQCACLINVRSK